MIQDIAPAKYSNEYKTTPPADSDLVVICRGSRLLCRIEESASLPTVAEAESLWGLERTALQFLVSTDTHSFFMADPSLDEAGDYIWHNVMEIRGLEPLDLTFTAAVGTHLCHWYDANRFCGRCGHPTAHKLNQRALTCPACGNEIFPRISPITITAVVDGDRMLLAQYNIKHRNVGRNHYVLLAGYCEIGESYEDTVRREVMEETGLKVRNVRYVTSQPWPFSDTSIAGFYAEADSSQPLRMQEDELSELTWFKREELPLRKNRTSVTDNLIEWFRAGMSIEDIRKEREALHK